MTTAFGGAQARVGLQEALLVGTANIDCIAVCSAVGRICGARRPRDVRLSGNMGGGTSICFRRTRICKVAYV